MRNGLSNGRHLDCLSSRGLSLGRDESTGRERFQSAELPILKPFAMNRSRALISIAILVLCTHAKATSPWRLDYPELAEASNLILIATVNEIQERKPTKFLGEITEIKKIVTFQVRAVLKGQYKETHYKYSYSNYEATDDQINAIENVSQIERDALFIMVHDQSEFAVGKNYLVFLMSEPSGELLPTGFHCAFKELVPAVKQTNP